MDLTHMNGSSVGDVREFREYLLSVAQLAERGFGERFVVSCAAADAPGRVHMLTDALASGPLGCNVVGATGTVVAGHIVVLLLVSGRPGLDRETVEQVLQQRLPDSQVFVLPAEALRAPSAPVRTSAWTLIAEGPEGVGVLRDATAPIAQHDMRLLRFSTWVEDVQSSKRCVMAVSVEANAGQDGSAVLAAAAQALESRGFAPADLTWKPTYVVPLTPGRPYVPGRTALVSLVGDAQPGLVHAAVETVAARDYSIVGSAMSVLEGYTALMLLLDFTTAPLEAADDLTRALEEALQSRDEERVQRGKRPYGAQVRVRAGDTDLGHDERPPTRVTHVVDCTFPDAPGLLAELTRAVQELEFNIVRLRSGRDSSSPGQCHISLELSAMNRAAGGTDSATALADHLRWELKDYSPGRVVVQSEPTALTEE